MTKKLLALYGLKWNPFAPDVPVEALHVKSLEQHGRQPVLIDRRHEGGARACPERAC